MSDIKSPIPFKEIPMPKSITFRSLLSLFVLASLLIGLPPCLGQDAQDPEDFSLVIMPDTQYYSETFHENYAAQTQWILDVSEERDVRFVIHVGDVVQNPGVEDEWKVASAAHEILDGKVPYSIAMGNHDGLIGDRTLYNVYFPPSRFQQIHDNAWYGGNRTSVNDSNIMQFRAAGMDFLVISLSTILRRTSSNGLPTSHKPIRNTASLS